MKKIRIISDRWTEEDVNFLLQLGIKAKPGYMIIRIDEDERYYVVRKHFEERWKPLLWSRDGWSYEYSREEFEKSEYFLLRDSRSCGYPQPEEDFRYESISFDAEKICSKCGCGRVQTNDLRVKKLSKHGFWTFFSWLIDEFFVSEKVYEEVFAPCGIEKRSVIKGGKVVDGVYQLIIPVAEEQLDLSDRAHWICPVCGTIRYDYVHQSYPYFPLHNNPLPGIYKTNEYFCTGARSHQAQHTLLISKEVAQKLIKLKDLKMDWLIPCRRKDD
jgi:hypothetical protein